MTLLHMQVQSADAAAPQSGVTQQDLFVSGQGGYATYRIPSLITTNDGTLLAFCEGRRNGRADSGDIDLLVRRSTDGGTKWSDATVVWDEGPNTCGNPCPVVDASTGTIWMAMTWNSGNLTEKDIKPGFGVDSRRVFIASSNDDGVTWSEPREITSEVKQKEWTWYATGPGAGIQIQHGAHRGRMVFACDHKVPNEAPNDWFSHVIYSDDHGATWKRGGSSPGGQENECEVVELSDGQLMLNMRNKERSSDHRQVAFSNDGGATWENQHSDPVLVEPVCQASIRRIAWPANGEPGMLCFSNPADKEKRRNMTVRTSLDDGKTWPYVLPIYQESSAYSSLAKLPDGTVGCLYEADDYGRIVLARIPVAALLSAKVE
ncbi:sialidase family protein [Aeoliella sp. SH292]|uniref:sialidase family protein n=1 Tax=Aeoliella sp. SH292 TaxID=3454464 RepID=UPI003F94A201